MIILAYRVDCFYLFNTIEESILYAINLLINKEFKLTNFQYIDFESLKDEVLEYISEGNFKKALDVYQKCIEFENDNTLKVFNFITISPQEKEVLTEDQLKKKAFLLLGKDI